MGVRNKSAIHTHKKMQRLASLVLLLATSTYAYPAADSRPLGYEPAPGVAVAAPLRLKASPYSFAYEVVDPEGGTNYGHREQSDGVVTEGEYRVAMPDGRTQIVTYQVSDATGYVADVRYEGEIIPYIPPVAVPARLEEAERSSSAASEPVTSKGLTPRGSRPGRRNKR